MTIAELDPNIRRLYDELMNVELELQDAKEPAKVAALRSYAAQLERELDKRTCCETGVV